MVKCQHRSLVSTFHRWQKTQVNHLFFFAPYFSSEDAV